MSRRLVGTGLVIVVALLLGRVMGLLRELVLAHLFGVTRQADIAVLVLTLPDVLASLLIGGALGAALVPEFARGLDASGSADALLAVVARWTLLIAGAATAVLCLASGAVVTILAPGFGAPELAQASRLVALAVWALPLGVLTAVATAYLHAKSQFAVAAFGTVVANAAILGALLMGGGTLLSVSLGVLAAAIVRLATVLAAVRGAGWRAASGAPPIELPAGLGRRYLQALGTGSLLLLTPVVARAISSLAGPGGVATLNYSTKLIEVALSACIGVVPIVLFPRLAHLVAAGRDAEMLALARQGARLTWVLSVPFVLALAWGGPLVAGIVFGRTAVDSAALPVIGGLTALAAFGLPAVGLVLIIQSVFNARSDAGGPLGVAAGGVLLGAASGVAGFALFRLNGLVAGIVVSQWLTCVGMERVLRRRHHAALLDSGFVYSALRSSLAGLAVFVPIALVGPSGSLASGFLTLSCAAAGALVATYASAGGSLRHPLAELRPTRSPEAGA